jgi:hypothetical protein
MLDGAEKYTVQGVAEKNSVQDVTENHDSQDEAENRSSRFELMTFSEPVGVPQELAAPLLERSIPRSMLEYFMAASELTLVETPRRGQLVCFGRVMDSYRVCLDPCANEVFAIIDGHPGYEPTEWPINSSLEQFLASVEAVLNRYPFDSGQTQGRRYIVQLASEWNQAADDLKQALDAIDSTAITVPDGFWMTFLDEVQRGNFLVTSDA